MWCIFAKIASMQLCGGKPFCRAHRKTLFSGWLVNGNSKSINVCMCDVRAYCAVHYLSLTLCVCVRVPFVPILLLLFYDCFERQCVSFLPMCHCRILMRQALLHRTGRPHKVHHWHRCLRRRCRVHKNLIYLDKINRFIQKQLPICIRMNIISISGARRTHRQMCKQRMCQEAHDTFISIQHIAALSNFTNTSFVLVCLLVFYLLLSVCPSPSIFFLLLCIVQFAQILIQLLFF